MPETNSQAFQDISLSFKAHPVTGDIQVLRNEDAIKRAVRNLVQTIPGERPFQDTVGTDVTSSLFDFVDFGSANLISQQIFDVLSNYESRIANTKVVVRPNPDDNAFDILINYDIVGDEFPRQEFQFILEPTR
tara:strand:+ start:300 stop:698 length:399 start_codon:yes stop_codon:yes gene_type:complete